MKYRFTIEMIEEVKNPGASEFGMSEYGVHNHTIEVIELDPDDAVNILSHFSRYLQDKVYRKKKQVP